MQACMQAIVDPERIPQFSMKLLQAYNFQFKSIEKVVCLPEEKIKEIDQGKLRKKQAKENLPVSTKGAW